MVDDQTYTILETLYHKYNHPEFIPPDPLEFVYRYHADADREIVGFLAAALAYGRVRHIHRSLTDLLGRMGKSPRDFVQGFTQRRADTLTDFKHRFNTGRDIADLLMLFQGVLKTYGSLEAFFLSGYSEDDETILTALKGFCQSLLQMYESRVGVAAGRGLKYLLASPGAGGASKRLHLFLRWMVRRDAVDPGVWKTIPASKLIVPVDVHIARLTRILGFHQRRAINAKAAAEITAGFTQFSPDDPVKYDFALSRIGILENCNGQYRSQCKDCELWGYCEKRQDSERF